jgi:membrane protease YdiL (CAAX protease family)
MDIKHSHLRPGLQFLVFWSVFLGIFFAGNIIGVAVAIGMYGSDVVNDISKVQISSVQARNAIWIIQVCGTTLPIFLAPVVFAYAIVREPDDYLKPQFEFSWKLVVLAFFITLLSTVLNEFLANVNARLDLSSISPGLDRYIHDSEAAATKMSDALLQMPTVGSLIAVVLFVGLLTAIVEEFMFRGCLLTIMMKWTKNPHVAIWITAILFSAFHFEFLSFLPRVLLGGLFGYFVWWSGSVWTSVWAHFVNNGTVVILTYLAQHKLIGINPDDTHLFNSLAYIICLIFTLFLLLIYRKIALPSRLMVND